MIGYEDYLRLYTGDTRIRNANNRLCTCESDHAIWGDDKIYRTINMLLFSGVENEITRIREGQTFNYELMREPEILLQIMTGIAEGILSQPVSEKELVVFRMDREVSLTALRKGYTGSFFSCEKGRYDLKFSQKENPIALEVHISEGVHYADMEKILGKEYEMDEAEILLLPYQAVSISPMEQKNQQGTEVYRVDVLPDELNVKNILLGNEGWNVDEARKILISDESKNKALNGLKCLEKGIDHSAEIESYLVWKKALQFCFQVGIRDK